MHLAVRDGENRRKVMEEDRLVGDAQDLPYADASAVHTLAWRVWERVDAAQAVLFRTHASQIVDHVELAPL